MANTKRPPLSAVKAAARTLSQAAMAEAQRIRDEQGHGGHVAAQELEHLAINITGLASRIESMRSGR
jgi:hypothetical protein